MFPEKVFENLFRKPHGNPEQTICFYLKPFTGFHLGSHFHLFITEPLYSGKTLVKISNESRVASHESKAIFISLWRGHASCLARLKISEKSGFLERNQPIDPCCVILIFLTKGLRELLLLFADENHNTGIQED